jgi:hypothetical protein
MAICPRCNEEVHELVNVCNRTTFYNAYLDDYGDMRYTNEDYGEVDDSYYECPQCGETLFYDEDSAIGFLKQATEEGEEGTEGQTNPNNNIVLQEEQNGSLSRVWRTY